MRKFNNLVTFEWDRGNHNKNWIRHKVTNKECEEGFFDQNRIVYRDEFHSEKEKRYILLGKTGKQKLLFISFTRRGSKIRVISARQVGIKNQKKYYKR